MPVLGHIPLAWHPSTSHTGNREHARYPVRTGVCPEYRGSARGDTADPEPLSLRPSRLDNRSAVSVRLALDQDAIKVVL
jgi:hypothetical protein